MHQFIEQHIQSRCFYDVKFTKNNEVAASLLISSYLNIFQKPNDSSHSGLTFIKYFEELAFPLMRVFNIELVTLILRKGNLEGLYSYSCASSL